jgi:hypothetical protein
VAEYMILIYESEPTGEYTEEQWNEMGRLHGQFSQQFGAKLRGGNALQPISTATSIRSDLVTDGPFVETKEVLGGYYLIEAENLDEALEIAKHCPAPGGGVEVRPILDTSGM